MTRETLINLGIRTFGISALLTCIDTITGSTVLEWVTGSDNFSSSTRVTIGIATFVMALAAAQTLDKRLGYTS